MKLPANEVSSATTTFACMKSCNELGVHCVETFPLNSPSSSTLRRSGIFQALTPFVCHCEKTSSTCVSSITPAIEERFSFSASTRVARIGPDESTGEAMRTRSLAFPIAFATRWASASPCSGQNQARTWAPSTCSGRGSTFPECSTSPLVQSCSNASLYAYAIGCEATVTMTFSCRDQESSVQLVDPVQTDSPSRTTILWCIRSGTPATPRVGTGSASIASGTVAGGGGTGIGPGWATL